ncbi:MAG: response regulator [Deltaproteobacteria bacterium]|jgi:CheY-like chemotaxis protein/signal transduction histidine kinase/HPt (histidine-containing phosphotransfer) domain-containing protein|nr:response regulator [Deltaproteobacteria bacterium]
MSLLSSTGIDRLKIVLVWVAFAAMAALGFWAAGSSSGGDMRRNLESRFTEAESNIRLNLRSPRAAFNNIHDQIESMLSSEFEPSDIEAFIESANSRLKESAPGEAGVFGVYGTVRNRFYDPSGIFREQPEALQGKGWYQAALKGEQLDYSGPYKDRKTGELVLSLARILYTHKGEYLGILCMNVGLNWLNSYAGYLSLAEGGYGVIVNQDGTILAHPDRALTGKSFSFLSPGTRQILERSQPEASQRLGPLEDTSGRDVYAFTKKIFNGWRLFAAVPLAAGGGSGERVLAVLGTAGFVFACLISLAILRLSRARVAAEKENESKTTFLTRISHEIRTPMNAIVGMSDLLLRSEKDMSAQCRAWALNIKHAGDLLLSIINDILDFSTIRSGSFKFVPLSYTLSSLINDSINIIMVRLQEKSLVFLVYVDGKLPNYLRGDVTRVRQIILNILSNAVKYTREGYVYLMVKGSIRPGTNVLELRISIKDTGIGIKPEDRDKLFADFSRVDPHQNRNVEGTGLGLTITKSLCQMMHGTIDFESTYGLGSSFNVMVPQEIDKSGPFAVVVEPGSRKVLASLNRDDYAKSLSATLDNLDVRYTLCRNPDELERELEDGPCDYSHVLVQNAVFQKEQARIERCLPGARVGVITEGPPGRPARNFTYLQSPVYSLAVADFLNNIPSQRGRRLGRERRERILIPKGRILVVDDLETNLQVASALLSEYGCRIDTSSTAAESLDLVKRHRYDIVFMDHMMPNMDGVEATRIIRSMENGRHRDLPIIALTANAVSGMKDMFLSHGFNDFISKPIDLNVLEEAVRRWIPHDKIIFMTEEELAQQAAEAAAAEAREMERTAVEMPLATLRLPAFPRGAVREAPLGPEPPQGFSMPSARILLVDDLPTNVEVARALLAEYGGQVDAARGGAESVEMVQAADYDLVFMDHMMPGMDGMEAVRVIRSLPDPKYRSLPIVALTANIVPGVREAFLSSGFDDFIAKPIDVGLLESVLVRWIPREKLVFPEGAGGEGRLGGEDSEPPEQPAFPPGLPEAPPSQDLVDFGEGARKSRGEAGYRRILGVFQSEGDVWARTLKKDFPPAEPRELLNVFQDMETSASIIGAFGLAMTAASLARAARGEDLGALEEGRFRCLAILRNVLIRVEDFLAGMSSERLGAPVAPTATPAGPPPSAPPLAPTASGAAGFGPVPGREGAETGETEDTLAQGATAQGVPAQGGPAQGAPDPGGDADVPGAVGAVGGGAQAEPSPESPGTGGQGWPPPAVGMSSPRKPFLGPGPGHGFRGDAGDGAGPVGGPGADAGNVAGAGARTAADGVDSSPTAASGGPGAAEVPREGAGAGIFFGGRPRGGESGPAGWDAALGLENPADPSWPGPAPVLPPEIEALTEVDFQSGLDRCRGQKDRFKKLLGFYVSDLDGWQAMVEEGMATGTMDMKNATISFHAMKSASATVGAMKLSEEAAGLEKAGREEDSAYILSRLERCSRLLAGVRHRIETFISEPEA